MVLDAKRRQAFMANSGHSIVVQVSMSYHHALRQIFLANCKAVILRCDLNFFIVQVLDDLSHDGRT